MLLGKTLKEGEARREDAAGNLNSRRRQPASGRPHSRGKVLTAERDRRTSKGDTVAGVIL